MWRDKLRKGKRIVGTMIRMVKNPAVIQIAKNAGLDYVMFDMEHGSFSLETVDSIFQVSNALELGSFARIPELTKGFASRVMDCGAEGVMVPMIDSVEQTENLVGWTKFAPLGKRGLGSVGSHTAFRSVGGTASAFMDQTNRDTIAIAQIETTSALDVIEDIAGVSGIDVLFVGPNDLSISLGVPGDVLGDTVESAISRIALAADKHGKIFGMHGSDALLERWVTRGLTFIMSSLDITMLSTGMAAITEKYGE